MALIGGISVESGKRLLGVARELAGVGPMIEGMCEQNKVLLTKARQLGKSMLYEAEALVNIRNQLGPATREVFDKAVVDCQPKYKPFNPFYPSNLTSAEAKAIQELWRETFIETPKAQTQTSTPSLSLQSGRAIMMLHEARNHMGYGINCLPGSSVRSFS